MAIEGINEYRPEVPITFQERKEEMKTKQTIRSRNQGGCPSDRSGFTLVELLVVITIIGAIAALTIPAIGRVMRTVRVKAMRAEMTNIQGGIDNYFTKYGDYPPDFSDWNLVKRHYLKIFPDIASSEISLLYRLCDDVPDDATGGPDQMIANAFANPYNPTLMDRSEAIVWSLGGFSADPQFPFTGPGGPLARLPGTAALAVDDPRAYEYNPIRNAPEIDFQVDRLSVQVFDPSNVNGKFYASRTDKNRNESFDEGDVALNDLFPNYVLRDDAAPIVYFDSRTYRAAAPNTLPSPAPPVSMNGYARRSVDGQFDSVRPVYSTTAKNPPASAYGSFPNAADAWEFMNPRTYQLIAPGLDGLFGDVADLDGGNPSDNRPAYFQIDGGMIVLDPTATTPIAMKAAAIERFDLTSVNPNSDNSFRDNMANFLPEGNETFEDILQ